MLAAGFDRALFRSLNMIDPVCQFKGQLEAELRPFPNVGLDFDVTAHQLNQALADRQPKPRSLKPPGNGCIPLRKFQEQCGQNFLPNADAGVANSDAKIIISIFTNDGRGFDGHPALLGELHLRISNRVDVVLTSSRSPLR